MLIFSFDCAIKNFGYCVIEITPTDWRQQLAELIKTFHTMTEMLRGASTLKRKTLAELLELSEKLKTFLDGLVTVKAIGVRDIRDEQTEKLSAAKAKIFLNELDKTFGNPDFVLVEKQMSLNNHAYAVENFVEYHYALVSQLSIVSPGLKNLICFDQKNGRYDCFAGKQNNYQTNKKHTTYNCKYFFEKSGLWQKFEFDKFKKFDDLSDAFMMCMAWVLLKS